MKNYIEDKINKLVERGWHSIRTYYTNSKNDWVLILQLGNDGAFLIPKVAEYRFSQAKWFDINGDEIDETIDTIIAWQYLPDPIQTLDSRIINSDKFKSKLNDYLF